MPKTPCLIEHFTLSWQKRLLKINNSHKKARRFSGLLLLTDSDHLFDYAKDAAIIFILKKGLDGQILKMDFGSPLMNVI